MVFSKAVGQKDQGEDAMHGEKPKQSPDVLYSPPTRQALDAYARRVCRTLGGVYNETEFLQGFAAHVKLTAKIQTQFLNKQPQKEFDNAE